VFIAPIPPFLLKTDDNPDGVDRSVFEDIQESILKDRLAYLTDFYNVDQTLGTRLSKEVVQYSWNIASVASPKGTYDCVAAWLTDFRPDVPKITIPSLIIQGDEDRILPYPLTGKRLHQAIKRSSLVTLKGAPHGISWTHAQEVNKALLDF
jgi:non-heme chloroperoxidase